MTYREGQVYPRGAGAGCGGLAIWQPGWAAVFFLDIWINTANNAPSFLKKCPLFLGNSTHRQDDQELFSRIAPKDIHEFNRTSSGCHVRGGNGPNRAVLAPAAPHID